MWHAQIFVENSTCCQGAQVDVDRSIKNFLEANQMSHKSGLDNSVGNGNVEK